jgi:hypothetical protein
MQRPVIYETLARIYPLKPVDRIDFIASRCTDQHVLDIGCYDETALIKKGTDAWLHGRIASVAKSVIGIDSSEKIPSEGIETGVNSKIFRSDAFSLGKFSDCPVSLIVAGEFIEHIHNPVDFIEKLRCEFPGRKILLSTPNGVSVANFLLGLISREAQHPDHVHVFTYKILNTLCIKAGLTNYQIIPYHFFATEMLLNSKGGKKIIVKVIEYMIRSFERFFPLLSFGYIVSADI